GGDEAFGIVPYLVADLVRNGRLLTALSLVRHHFPGASSKASWRPTARVLLQFGLRPALPRSVYSGLQRLRGAERNAPPFLGERATSMWAATGDGLRFTRDGGAPRWWLGLRELLID